MGITNCAKGIVEDQRERHWVGTPYLAVSGAVAMRIYGLRIADCGLRIAVAFNGVEQSAPPGSFDPLSCNYCVPSSICHLPFARISNGQGTKSGNGTRQTRWAMMMIHP